MAADSRPFRLEIAQRPAMHLGQRDFDKYAELLSEDVTYRVGGNDALASTSLPDGKPLVVGSERQQNN